jgi:hypothetical protein
MNTQTILGFLNVYVLRFLWMRISWQEATVEQGPIIPGSFRFHFQVHPSWLMKKDLT